MLLYLGELLLVEVIVFAVYCGFNRKVTLDRLEVLNANVYAAGLLTTILLPFNVTCHQLQCTSHVFTFFETVVLISAGLLVCLKLTASPRSFQPLDPVLERLRINGYSLTPGINPKNLHYDHCDRPMMRSHMDFEPSFEKPLFWAFMLIREAISWGLSYWVYCQYLQIDTLLELADLSFGFFTVLSIVRGILGVLMYSWIGFLIFEWLSYYCFLTGHPLIEWARRNDLKPQFILPGPAGGFPFPRTVHSPLLEFWEFYLFRTPTYVYKILRTALFYIFSGGLQRKPMRFISDSELGRFLTATYYSHFLRQVREDNVPLGALKQLPNSLQGHIRWYIYDVSQQMEYLAGSKHHWSGFFISPNKSFYYRVDDGAVVPVLIQINGLDVMPQHTNAWKLAKIHVGLNFLVEPLYTHPKHHFAYDFAAARMLSDIPYDHILRRLLDPHTYNTIELNNVVLNHPNTPLKPDWWKTYTPFTIDFELQLGSIVNGLNEWEFVANPVENTGVFNLDFPFAKAMQEYYFCMRRFVASVEASIPRDQYVINWMSELHRYVKGFPSTEALLQDKQLFTSVVANIMFTLSVGHCCDHIFEGLLDTTWSPNRVRIPPPSSLDMPDFEPENVCNHWDMLKHATVHNVILCPDKTLVMDFSPYDQSIINTRYFFKEKHLQEAVHTYRQDLLDTAWNIDRVYGTTVPLSKLTQSIVY
jgi:hypothetical protein